MTYDWLLYEKIKPKIMNDTSLIDYGLRERVVITTKIYECVEFFAEFTFFVVVPIVFVSVSDRIQILSLGIIMLILGLTVPLDKEIKI